LTHLVGILLEGDNPEEFLEHTKLELFHDQVFCFTPKGRLIALPRGANCIDFAYAVHTQVGNTAVGAKINGRPMPLATPLRNGDEVEIVCSDAQSPPVAWERLAITGKARSAIRRASRDAVRLQYDKLGREILDRAFRRHGQAFSEEAIGKALPRLSQKTAEDVVTAVGRGELASGDVFRAAFPEEIAGPMPKRRRQVKRADEGWFGLGKVMGLKFRWPGSGGKGRAGGQEGPEGIPIRGLKSGLPVNFAEGGAIPGDRIVGILSPGHGITIYPIHAAALKAFDDEPERWIDVTWDIDEDDPQRFPAKIAVTAMNEPGSLAQIATVIGEVDGNIQNIRMTNQVADYTEMLIDLDVWDLQHLNEILTGLRAKDVVSSATRSED
jgi:(p)ppGpp synthase/HD superfamily hydrolase